MDYNVLKELFKIPRRSAGLCKSKKDKIIRKCNNKIKVKFVRLPLGKVLEVSRSCSLESRSWAQHEGGCHWDFAGGALHQQSRHDVLRDSLAKGQHLCRVRKFLRSIIKFQLFSPYKPTDAFVSAGLQFGLERDAKHHRGMPSGAGRLSG